MVLYFDFLPEELIEILFIYLKFDSIDFIKISSDYRRIYDNAIQRGNIDPYTVFRKLCINENFKKNLYDWAVRSSNILILTEEDKKLTGFNSKILIHVNDIKMDDGNKEKLLKVIKNATDNIQYLYIDAWYDIIRNNNVNIKIGKLYNGKYFLFSKFSSLTSLNTLDFKTSSNWQDFWNKSLNNDLRQFLLEWNNFPNKFRFELKFDDYWYTR